MSPILPAVPEAFRLEYPTCLDCESAPLRQISSTFPIAAIHLPEKKQHQYYLFQCTYHMSG